MKKLTYLLGVSLAMVMGCTKENCEHGSPATAPTTQEQSPLHRVIFDKNGAATITSVDASLLQVHPQKGGNPEFQGETPHQAIGNFTLAPGGPDALTDTSNVIANSGGIHGSIVWTGRFGVHMDAICLQVIGNEGICSGVITSVENDQGFPDVFAVGNILIFKVKDNGEGSKAPVDQINDALFYWAPVFGAFPCGADFSGIPWSAVYDDIVRGGQIQVK